MATLDPNTGGGIFGYNIPKTQPLPPPGQYLGVCLHIRDQMGVDRKAYQSEEIEKQDVTRFLFGIVDAQNNRYLVQTFEFKISGGQKSNLVLFLKAWRNTDPYHFDYLTMVGQGAMLTIGHKASTKTPGLVYPSINGITPVFPQLQAQIPPASHFADLLTLALQTPADPAAARPTDKVAQTAASFGAPVQQAPTPPAWQHPQQAPVQQNLPAWGTGAGAPPPPPAMPPLPPPGSAPTPPAPPPPPPADRQFWANVNGVVTQVSEAQVKAQPALYPSIMSLDQISGWVAPRSLIPDILPF